jgi:gliding motility-associated-like protein
MFIVEKQLLKLLPAFFLLFFGLNLAYAQDPALIAQVKPLSGFMENIGQLKDQHNEVNKLVKYLLPLAGGMNVQLRANGFSYDTYTITRTAKNTARSNKQNKNADLHSPVLKFNRVDVDLLGAKPAPKIIATYPSVGHTNYINTAAKKTLVVNSYRQVTYQDIYSNIDLVCRVNTENQHAKFEYYFLVRPHGDVSQIKLRYKGALKTQIIEKNIVLNLPAGKLMEHMPASYLGSKDKTDVDHLPGEKNIKVRYSKLAADLYGFQTGPYDRSQTLVIDPTPDLLWGTYYGGNLVDIGYSIAKDAAGNIFVGGGTDSGTGIATAGTYQSTMLGYSDGFIAKFTPGGSLLWTTYYGGSNYDQVNSIAVDKNNDIIVGGSTFSPDHIATPGSYQTTKTSPTWGTSAFIAKFSNNGEIIWGSYFGGEGVESGNAIAIDNNNNILLTGSTTSYTGVASPGAYQTQFTGDGGMQISDAYVAKFDDNGNRLWSTYFGGHAQDSGYGIIADKQNHVIITGLTYSPSGIATSNAQQTTIGSVDPAGGDGFIAKFNDSGKLSWTTYCGGSGGDFGWCLGINSNNEIIMVGATASTNNIATPGTQQTTTANNPYQDGFIVKYDASGKKLWGTYYGGESSDYIYGLTVDATDNIWITGATGSDNMATPGTYQPTKAPGESTAFIAKFNNSGLRIWGSYYGTGGYNAGQGNGIVITGPGEAVITGETQAANKIASCSATQKQFAGNGDIFVAKFSETVLSTQPSVTITQAIDIPVCAGTLVSLTASPVNGGTAPSYQWQVNGKDVGTNSSTYSSNSFNNDDAVTCILTSNSPCITTHTATSNTLTLNVTSPVIPTVSITSSANTICTGTLVTFTANADNGGNTPAYQWKLNGINVGANAATYSNANLVNSDIVTCTLTSSASCVTTPSAGSNPVTMTVNAIAAPSITISTTGNGVCEGAPVKFTATPANAGGNPVYQWQVNNTNVGDNSSSYETSNLKNGDVVSCLLTAPVSSCNLSAVSSNRVAMDMYPLPAITITAQSGSILKGNSTQLTATVPGNVQSYQWAPAEGLDNSTIANPKASPLVTTTYMLLVTSVNGCQASSGIKITVLTDIKIYNTFSPNGDGINDLWEIPGLSDYLDCTVDIYNRYGSKIFHSVGYSQPWNGTYNNSHVPAGVYYYFVNLHTGKQPYSGNVTVIR